MSDLIQTLRDLASLYANEDPNTPIDEFIVSQAATEIEKLQQRLAAAEAKIPKWIPVSEANPERCGDYLITAKKDDFESVFECEYDSLREKWESNYVVAWMELPERYKGE